MCDKLKEAIQKGWIRSDDGKGLCMVDGETDYYYYPRLEYCPWCADKLY